MKVSTKHGARHCMLRVGASSCVCNYAIERILLQLGQGLPSVATVVVFLPCFSFGLFGVPADGLLFRSPPRPVGLSGSRHRIRSGSVSVSASVPVGVLVSLGVSAYRFLFCCLSVSISASVSASVSVSVWVSVSVHRSSVHRSSVSRCRLGLCLGLGSLSFGRSVSWGGCLSVHYHVFAHTSVNKNHEKCSNVCSRARGKGIYTSLLPIHSLSILEEKERELRKCSLWIPGCV